MSQIFYESDNLTITGSGGSLNFGNHIIGTIRLIFSIHINGKLKTFFHEFELDREEVTSEPEGIKYNYYILKNWYAWNAVHETLLSLGYMQDTKPNIINFWTRDIGSYCDKLGVNTPVKELQPIE